MAVSEARGNEQFSCLQPTLELFLSVRVIANWTPPFPSLAGQSSHQEKPVIPNHSILYILTRDAWDKQQ